MEYYLSENFLIESLKSTFCDPDFDIEEVDEHVPLIDLSDLWGEYPSLAKIEFINWGIHQRLFIDPDKLDDLIYQSIFDIASVYKNRPRMIPREFEEMYWIFGSIKVIFFEQFQENLDHDIDFFMEQNYLNQKN